MAGIGFQLNRIAREGGLGGVANAALHGAFISAGPWLFTAFAVLMLQQWTAGHLDQAENAAIHSIIVYCFTASTVIAAPVAMVATRMTSDSIFVGNPGAVPGIFLAALAWVTVPAVIAGGFLFGVLVALPPGKFLFAMAIMTLLTHIWIAGPFLTTAKRHVPILAAYAIGSGVTALSIMLFDVVDPAMVLVALAAGLAVTLAMLSIAICEEYPAGADMAKLWDGSKRQALLLGVAGLANALAIWVDKWILWFGDESVQTIGKLRINPINDQASFLGLLTLVPGLTIVLITTETRFSVAFKTLVDRCTGTATYRNIEKARQEVARTIMRDLRLLAATQAIVASLIWILAPEILRVLGSDMRGLFALRFTAIGAVFHIIAIHATIVMSYYDLFDRVLAVWVVFVLASIVATLASLDGGFASFGWGYMVGALASATLAIALAAEATTRLNYLLFVGNNPAVVGGGGRLPA